LNTQVHVGNNSCNSYIAYPTELIGGDALKRVPMFLLLHDAVLNNTVSVIL